MIINSVLHYKIYIRNIYYIHNYIIYIILHLYVLPSVCVCVCVVDSNVRIYLVNNDKQAISLLQYISHA